MGSDEVEQNRRRQAELYGESLAAIVDDVARQTGLEPAEIAKTIGVSRPMFTQLVSGRRVRVANPVAAARLEMLREFVGHLAAGLADRADVPLTIAQIRASTGSWVTSSATAVADREPAEASDGAWSAEDQPAAAPETTPSWPRQVGASDDPPALTPSSLLAARERVGRQLPPTPTRRWPLLEDHTETETWVKHENHNPTGAFKVRGGINFVERLLAAHPETRGLVSATRGNHGQSLAFAGQVYRVPVTIVVPEGNSADKNAAMAAYGARLVVRGRDFQESLEYAEQLAGEERLLVVPPFHPWLIEGVATYAAELHETVPDLDVIYVPVGMGSGICANIAVRDLLGRSTEIVGVVAERAPAYAMSFDAGAPISTGTAKTFVDGVAVRTPDRQAVRIIRAGASRILQVSEDEAALAMVLMYRATHNLAEPAGSLALAGLLSERDRVAGKRVAIVHTGANADFSVLKKVMKEFG